MNYRYCDRENFEDFASGRVLYGGKGIPNFPVRLICEIFLRARSCARKQTELTVYDPCCGGGYSLSVLGLICNDCIGAIMGSDISPDMTEHAERNLRLLTYAGLAERRRELAFLYEQYQKPSHRDALESAGRLEAALVREIPSRLFTADCTGPLPDLMPDIIITDVPYGNLVDWGGGADPLEAMAAQLRRISRKGTVLAVVTDKKQKVRGEGWERLEKETVGKRRFEILRAC